MSKLKQQRAAPKGQRTKNINKRRKRYAADNKKVHKLGRQDALAELAKPDTVYLLAKEPTYIHSREVYYKAGQTTALSLVENAVNRVYADTQSKIASLIPFLDDQIVQVQKACHKEDLSWEEFAAWWYKDVMNTHVDQVEDASTRIQLLGLLDKFKNNQTQIQMYKLKRNAALKSGDTQELKDLGFISGDVELVRGQSLESTTPIEQLRQVTQQKLAAQISKLLEQFDINDQYIDAAKAHLAGKSKTSWEAVSATQIGRLEEAIINGVSAYITDTVQVKFSTVAREKIGNSKDADKWAGSTADTFVEGINVHLRMPMSDKTGMIYYFGKQGNNKTHQIIDRFTVSAQITDFGFSDEWATLNNVADGTTLQEIILYILRNEDYWGASSESNAKEMIVSLFAWLKVLEHTVGTNLTMNTEDNTIPIVVNHFGRLYKMSGVLSQFYNIGILGIVSKNLIVREAWKTSLLGYSEVKEKNKDGKMTTKQQKWDKINPKSLTAKPTLRSIKKQALQKIGHNGAVYEALHQDAQVAAELTNIVGKINRRFQLDIRFNLRYQNAETLGA